MEEDHSNALSSVWLDSVIQSLADNAADGEPAWAEAIGAMRRLRKILLKDETARAIATSKLRTAELEKQLACL